MSESKSTLTDKKAITPLWIVALFVSLTETVLGIAVTQTTSGIQIALTAFVIIFPILIAAFFFAILWFRPYVFYPPTEFGRQTSVIEYVEAMQRRPSLMKRSPDAAALPPTDKEKIATSEIAELFIQRVSPWGFLVLYAYHIAYTRKQSFDYSKLIESTDALNFHYGWGFVVAAKAAGLIGSTTEGGITKVTYFNDKLQHYLRAGPDEMLERKRTELELDEQFMDNFRRTILSRMSQIEQFFA